jgi:hypothetical protein
MSRTYTLQFSSAALDCIEETGIDPLDDLHALIHGGEFGSPEKLLAHCLDGADENREQGWREYVEILATASRIADANTAIYKIERM